MSKKVTLTNGTGTNKKPMKIAIIGGGLVGSLAALHLAKKGYQIHLYEYREDIRTAEFVQGRSINLALSQRGRKALADVGLEEVVLSTAIPMCGRMLHDTKGKQSIIIYDPCTNQCLYSVGRKHLNEILITEGEKYQNIYFHFEHKLISTDLNEGRMVFKHPYSNKTITDTADLVIGCDGAFSTVRQQMIKCPGFNYSQQYIEHGYLELCIPAKNDQFQMPENYLHIWPRDTFMMIALPNQDKSFTVTLSMPFKSFQNIKNSGDLLQFFETHFPDAIPLIGEEKLIEDFFKLKPQHMISVKCQSYHVGSKALILGDAAHAMVPYMGQGMNAGFEDCTLLMSILNKNNLNIENVLQEFSEQRCEDAQVICDIALFNYIEMRDLTKRLSFRCRKKLDNFLFKLFPNIWVPLYNSVSFTSIPYRKCIENRKWQDNVLEKCMLLFGVTSAAFALGIYLSNKS